MDRPTQLCDPASWRTSIRLEMIALSGIPVGAGRAQVVDVLDRQAPEDFLARRRHEIEAAVESVDGVVAWRIHHEIRRIDRGSSRLVLTRIEGVEQSRRHRIHRDSIAREGLSGEGISMELDTLDRSPSAPCVGRDDLAQRHFVRPAYTFIGAEEERPVARNGPPPDTPKLLALISG